MCLLPGHWHSENLNVIIRLKKLLLDGNLVLHVSMY